MVICRKLTAVKGILMILGLIYHCSTSRGVGAGEHDLLFLENQMIGRIRTAVHDSERIRAIQELAFLYFDGYFDSSGADSISEMALEIARRSSDDRIRVMAWNSYVVANDLEIYHEKGIKLNQMAVETSRRLKDPALLWSSLQQMARLHLTPSKASYPIALRVSQECVRIAVLGHQKGWLVESLLLLGQSFEGLNLKVDALKQYLEAYDLAVSQRDTTLMIKCCSTASAFYLRNTLFEQSLEYKSQEEQLVRTVNPNDSTALMWILFIKMRIVFEKVFHFSKSNPHNSFNFNELKSLVDFAILTGNNRMKTYAFALFRSILIDMDQIETLRQIYQRQYPEEWIQLPYAQQNIYLRLKALFLEHEGRYDSALFYFKQAEEGILESDNLFNRSNFYFRFGQFYHRHNKIQEAIRNYRQALLLAQNASSDAHIPFIIASVKPLMQLHLELNDFRAAYDYASIYYNQIEKRQDIEKRDQVIRMDLINAQQKREIENLKEKQRQDQLIRKRQMERNLLAGGTVLFIIIIFFVYRNYRNQKRSNILLNIEKEKSDGLLLNILPRETADELKRTGTAKAKRFDTVTVMFTDFKNFTKASEELDAEVMVQKIHHYFSEFDRIISQFSIEKIKTIGDSYMCAAGIPIPTDTHAVDMVRAALEMQAFIDRERESARKKGELYFELRIGIHTGPVVAGIVGFRKFTYDIWGDTVNTASRMESSGEVNRVNVSETTYKLVRDHFMCTHRGKVSAKNMGEIDMYFVDVPE